MADISLYQQFYNISTFDDAFRRFQQGLRNYYGAGYYVHWEKVFKNIQTYKVEFAILSTLTGKPSIETFEDAVQIFLDYPKVVRCLPILLACRGDITLLDSETGTQETYLFTQTKTITEDSARNYARFLQDSGLLLLLEKIQRVEDYCMGVEVGLDSNGRKNRGGFAAEFALLSCFEQITSNLPKARMYTEQNWNALLNHGCAVPNQLSGVKWDRVFHNPVTNRFVLVEINHYGSGGSKPPAIAREYSERHQILQNTGIGFVWITDGGGWSKMTHPLRAAFETIDYVLNIEQARAGLLEAALRKMLLI